MKSVADKNNEKSDPVICHRYQIVFISPRADGRRRTLRNRYSQA